MARFLCPYLQAEVDLSDEREAHIREHHQDLLPENRVCILKAIADPDEVLRSRRDPAARLFVRWFDDLLGGNHVVVVIVTDRVPRRRHWIVTAYASRRSVEGVCEWSRS